MGLASGAHAARQVVSALIIGGALALAGVAQAQGPLNFPFIAYGTTQTLAPGAWWRTASSAPPNPVWQLRIVEVDLNNPNIDLVPLIREAPALKERTSTMAQRAGCVAAVNAGYFNVTTGDSVSYTKRDSVFLVGNIASRPPRATFGVIHNGGASPVPRKAWLDGTTNMPSPADASWNPVLDAIGGGPNLLTAGNLDVTTAPEGFDAASGVAPDTRQPRTAVGYRQSTNRVFLITVDGRQAGWSVGMSCTEVALFLKDLGCDYGITYDGGGSTAAWVAGTGLINRPSDSGNTERTVNSAWGVLCRSTVDNADGAPNFTTTGSWISSSNSPWYNTGSLVRTVGTAAGCTWSANLARSGLYDVQGWWVASSNRATNATYRIQTTTGTVSIPVNQTVGGGAWNRLGTFALPAGRGGTVSLDNAGANNAVSADAVSYIYRGELPTSAVKDYYLYDE